MDVEINKRKNELEKTIMVLEWDKSHGQLNLGRNTLLEGYKNELAGIKGAKQDE